MDTKNTAMTKVDVSQEELQALLKMRNKRTESYNLRVSEKELKFMTKIQEEVEAAGTDFLGRTDFIIHCVTAVATLTKSQTKLL